MLRSYYGGNTMELAQIVRLMLRWWWLIALLAIIGGGGAYLISQFQKPVYQAATTLLVIVGRPSRDGVTSQDLATRQQLAITYKELLIKRPVLEAAAAQVGIVPVDLDKQVQVELVKDTAILKLSAKEPDPQRAANLANAIVGAFMLQEQSLLANPYAADRSGLSVIEPAIPPVEPSGLGPVRNAILGSLIGALLAIGAVFAIEYFDTSIRSASDIAVLTGMPILAVIAKLRGRNPANTLITLQKPESADADAYRMIRAQIEFASTERPLRTLVVTSAQPREGKSVTAANLAIALAQTGLRVILIDANLRRPALHTLFQCPNLTGLSTALQQIGHGRAADHIVPTAEDHLSLLPSGPLPPNPARIFVPERIRMLTAELREHADMLIFDSPACLDMIDTSMLLRGCDATLLVVQARVTKAEGLLHTHQFLQASQTHILGTVLNQARNSRGSRSSYAFTPVPQRSALRDSAEDESSVVGDDLPARARAVGRPREIITLTRPRSHVAEAGERASES